MEGNSGRAVGRTLGISKNICLHWIRKYAKTLTKQFLCSSQSHIGTKEQYNLVPSFLELPKERADSRSLPFNPILLAISAIALRSFSFKKEQTLVPQLSLSHSAQGTFVKQLIFTTNKTDTKPTKIF